MCAILPLPAAGTGKTVLARAAAAAAGARLFVINGPDVVSEYYGESEAGLRGVFAAARALGPAVSCAPRRRAMLCCALGGAGLSCLYGRRSAAAQQLSGHGRPAWPRWLPLSLQNLSGALKQRRGWRGNPWCL